MSKPTSMITCSIQFLLHVFHAQHRQDQIRVSPIPTLKTADFPGATMQMLEWIFPSWPCQEMICVCSYLNTSNWPERKPDHRNHTGNHLTGVHAERFTDLLCLSFMQSSSSTPGWGLIDWLASVRNQISVSLRIYKASALKDQNILSPLV